MLPFPAAGEDGSAMLEFALCLPIFFFIFAAVVDYAIFIQQAMQVTQAAAAAAAYGAINGNTADYTGMQTAAQNAAPGVSGLVVSATDLYTCTPGGASVASSATCSGYGTPIKYVQVQTTASVSPTLRYFNLSSLTLRAVSTYRVSWTP